MNRGGHGDQQRRIVVHDVGRMKAVGIFLGDQIRAEPPFAKPRMFDQRRKKADVVRHAADVKLVQRVAQVGNGFVASCAMRDQLGDHRIVMDRDLAPFVDACIDSHRLPIPAAAR